MTLLDLTLTISEKLSAFPGSPSPLFIPWSTIKADGYNLELLFLSSHTGTHIDAPFHFDEAGSKIHQISLTRLKGRAFLIKCEKGPNQAITIKDIVNYEKKHGRIPPKSFVVFFTRWQKNMGKKSYFLQNPGLSKKAAKYLVSKKVNLVGIDSPSIDIGKDSQFSVHKIFSKNDILIVENLTNLNKISTTSFNLLVLPLKLKGATGSPVRALAL